jgi:hypothetical protein
MKKLSIVLAGASALTLMAGAASAQTWMSINDREARLESRIEAGMQRGDLTRFEARQLRSELNALEALEARYSANGLSAWERADLDRRFDILSQRVRMERADAQARPGAGWFGGPGWTDNRGQWVSLEQRKLQLDRRIDQGLRSGQLTRSEAARLRIEFDRIATLEARYRRDGRLSMAERADLDRRFDQLAAAIRFERRDNQYGYNERRY